MVGRAPLLIIPHAYLIPAMTYVPEAPLFAATIGIGTEGVMPAPLIVGADRIPDTGKLPVTDVIDAGPLQASNVHVTPPVVTPADVSAPAATIAPELEMAPTTWGFPAVDTWS
jgi:hypothetical protein